MKAFKRPLPIFLLAVAFTSQVFAPFAFGEEDEFRDKFISVDFDGVALKDVLKIFSQQSGLNFVASQAVETKKISVFLENAPVRDAFEGLISANGLRYEQKKAGLYVIYPLAGDETAPGGAAQTQTRIFKIRYARLSISPIDVGGQSTIRDMVRPEEINAVKEGGGGEGGQDAPKKDEEKDSNLMAERGLDKIVASMLSEDGHIAIDMGSNSLIITDTAQKISDIEKVIKLLDEPTRQVMIEVQLLEVNKNVLGNYGIEWGSTDGSLASFVGGARSTSFPFNLFQRSPGLVAGQNSDSITGELTQDSTLLTSTLSLAQTQAVLHYLTNQADTKILARPRVTTMNNEAASVKLLTKTVTGVKSTLVTSQSLTTFTVGEAVTENSGIQLRMTPQISEDGTIILFLEPSITTISNSNFFPDRFLEPTTRSIRTTTRVKDHETLVLGGLIDNNDLVTNKKIPILGDIPLLGNAFKYEDSNRRNREFLIFITPHILTGFNSTGPDSATSVGRDLAVKRLLDAFADDEIQMTIDPVQSGIRDAQPVLSQEKRLIAESAKRRQSPEMDQQMTKALDSMNKKSNIEPRLAHE